MTQVADTGEKVTQSELVELSIDGAQISFCRGTFDDANLLKG